MVAGKLQNVATAITACGFVTALTSLDLSNFDTSCNSDYRLRFCNLFFIEQWWRANVGCNSDYRLRFCNLPGLFVCCFYFGCNSDYRLRFCNTVTKLSQERNAMLVATAITACGFVTHYCFFYYLLSLKVATAITACGFVTINIFFNTDLWFDKVATAITACGFVTPLVCACGT